MTKLDIPFNNPMTYPRHSGVDFPQSAGTPFLASDSGVVEWLGSNSRGGYFIWVRYDHIAPRVGYHHMPSHDACPREGTRFGYGSQLGVVGSTGNSTGPHLHSEVEGYATTDGYWQFFNSNKVISIKSKESEYDNMIVNIQGRAGVRNGGAYYIADGQATFLGGSVSNAPTLTFDQGSALARRVSGI